MYLTIIFGFFIILDCGLLPGILNGQISFSSVTLNSVVTYSCERGFNLVGNSQRVCQANGQWSGMEPSCESKYTLVLHTGVALDCCPTMLTVCVCIV